MLSHPLLVPVVVHLPRTLLFVQLLVALLLASVVLLCAQVLVVEPVVLCGTVAQSLCAVLPSPLLRLVLREVVLHEEMLVQCARPQSVVVVPKVRQGSMFCPLVSSERVPAPEGETVGRSVHVALGMVVSESDPSVVLVVYVVRVQSAGRH